MSAQTLRQLERRQAAILGILVLGLVGGGAALLTSRGMVGSRSLFGSIWAWDGVALLLWLVGRALLAALGRWDASLGREFERRSLIGEPKLTVLASSVHLLVVGAALLTLLTLIDGGPFLSHQLVTLAVGFLPVALAGHWRVWRISAHELTGRPLPPSPVSSVFGRSWLYEGLVTLTVLLLTPLLGAMTAMRGLWAPGPRWRRLTVAGVLGISFVLTITVVRGLLDASLASEAQRMGLYLVLALFTGGALVMLRRVLLLRLTSPDRPPGDG